VRMRRPGPPRPAAGRPSLGRRLPAALGGGARLLAATLLGVLAAVLVSCGSSGAGLIPAASAGPLLGDFQAVERAAREAGGKCAATKAALSKTESNFQLLPASVDAGLHGRLHEGIVALRKLALEECTQPPSPTTTTGASTSATKTAPPPTATTEAPTTSTSTTETPPTGTTPGATQTSGAEGGTAPGVGSESQAGEGGAGSAQGGSGEGANGGGLSGGTGSGGGAGASGGNGQ
jgi:uncharacterized membrane protein YgcG